MILSCDCGAPLSLRGGHGTRQCTSVSWLLSGWKDLTDSAPPDPVRLTFGLVPRPGSVLGPETLSPLTAEAEATRLTLAQLCAGMILSSVSAGSVTCFLSSSSYTTFLAHENYV